jgi:serine/threonine protein kinase
MLRGSIREAMAAGPMAPEQAVQIGLGVCEALDYGHRRGLPHRHLVPENIFIDGSNRVRVADFGLAMLSGAGFVDGDARSDLQALGTILYELVTGVTPGVDAAPASRHVTGIPARLDELLARALASRPTERFGRATELALALRLVASNKSSNGLQERPQQDVVQLAVRGRLITITIMPEATETDIEAFVAKLDTLLGQQSRWRIAYDLGHLNVMDDGVRAVLQRVHIRHQKNIDRVAFCSPRALVRSSALVLGGSVKRVPWKSFASAGPMQAWLEEANP